MTCEKTKYGIGWAVCMIKAGGAVRRTGWPKDAYLRLQFDNQRNRETGATVFFMQWRNTDKKIKDLFIKEWTASSGLNPVNVTALLKSNIPVSFVNFPDYSLNPRLLQWYFSLSIA